MVSLSGSQLEYTGIQKLLPVVAHVCAATTSASVRITAFKALAAAAPRVSIEEAGAMVDTAARVLAVDTSAATVMSAVGLGDALAAAQGPKFGVQRVVPLLSPLLGSAGLNGTQFGSAVRVVRQILDAVEAARGFGGSGSVAGGRGSSASQRQQPGLTNGVDTSEWRVGTEAPMQLAPASGSQRMASPRAQRQPYGASKPSPAPAAGGYEMDLSALVGLSVSNGSTGMSASQPLSGQRGGMGDGVGRWVWGSDVGQWRAWGPPCE